MSVKFVGTIGALLETSPASYTLARPAGVKKGDLLYLVVVAPLPLTQESGGVTPPSNWWTHDAKLTDVGFDGPNFPITDPEGLHVNGYFYWVTDDEPDGYVFTDLPLTGCILCLSAYRGVINDPIFDVAAYPTGYYAPKGSGGSSSATYVLSQDGVGNISTPATVPNEARFSRALVVLAAVSKNFGFAVPAGDPSPRASVRFRADGIYGTAVFLDVLLEDVGLVPQYVSSITGFFRTVGVVRVFEPSVEAQDSVDSFKAKIMRRTLPPPYDQSYDSNIGQLITAIGGCDNDVGGLFGDADYLPDEV